MLIHIVVCNCILLCLCILTLNFQWEIAGASYKTASPQKLQSGAVVGAGTMGTGIAMAMLNAGMSVVLLEQNQKVGMYSI